MLAGKRPKEETIICSDRIPHLTCVREGTIGAMSLGRGVCYFPTYNDINTPTLCITNSCKRNNIINRRERDNISQLKY